MFNTTDKIATILTIPATYATAFGFIYAYGKLIVAMAGSKLFPKFFCRRWPSTGAPYVALITGSVLGYGICLTVYYYPYFGLQLFDVCILCAFSAYSAQCIGYIQLNTKFKNLKREFRSPLGIFGAVYSMLVFLLAAISVIGFQQDQNFAVCMVIVMCTTFTVYYFCYAKHRQTFSDEEKKVLFVAHVVNCKSGYCLHDSHCSSPLIACWWCDVCLVDNMKRAQAKPRNSGSFQHRRASSVFHNNAYFGMAPERRVSTNGSQSTNANPGRRNRAVRSSFSHIPVELAADRESQGDGRGHRSGSVLFNRSTGSCMDEKEVDEDIERRLSIRSSQQLRKASVDKATSVMSVSGSLATVSGGRGYVRLNPVHRSSSGEFVVSTVGSGRIGAVDDLSEPVEKSEDCSMDGGSEDELSLRYGNQLGFASSGGLGGGKSRYNSADARRGSTRRKSAIAAKDLQPVPEDMSVRGLSPPRHIVLAEAK